MPGAMLLVVVGQLDKYGAVDRDVSSSTHLDLLHAARLEWGLRWKAQDSYKLGVVARAAHSEFPVLKRCAGDWATSRIMKECWDNMKRYPRSIKNPNTYIGRKAIERQEKREHRRRRSTSSPSRHDSTPPRSPTPARQPSSPVAGPSQLRPSGSQRLPPSDDDENDDDMVSDVQPEDEEITQPAGKGKGRVVDGEGDRPKKRARR
ncbi:hypothetical protein C8F01DRAFT_1238559 [Mycena amicta]|nr:hypothetical protein C8F01DRAFT_1238559 [Mycena amicta]